MDAEAYSKQLDSKRKKIEEIFNSFSLPQIEVFDSPPLHFRMRAEFRIWHEGDRSYYAMTPKGKRKPEPISDFAIGSLSMANTMPALIREINKNPVLRKKLYACEFLTTLSGEVLVTLIYHRPLDEEWQAKGQRLAATLGIDLVGRSRKQKVVLGKDYVLETLNVDNKCYHYQQVETGFTQPNATVNQKMLGWAKDVTRDSDGDLLELYCGNGNFTVILSENFQQVLATEVSKVSVRSAQYNCELNGVKNLSVVRMSSEEFTEALSGVRTFNRLKDIDLSNYNFTTIFVDPPRAGLDEDTLELTKRFDRILYISCNPITLKENILKLSDTHKISRFALFDQFPWTDHVECGALLDRR